MELVEIDGVDGQRLQALVARFEHVRVAEVPRRDLRGDEDLVPPVGDRPADESFRPVGLGCVDEECAEFDSTVDDRRIAIGLPRAEPDLRERNAAFA